jgi:hypothetical protein
MEQNTDRPGAETVEIARTQNRTSGHATAVTAGHTDRESPTERLSRTRAYQDLPFMCRCGARWSGNITCHAACCHRTFSGVEAFDHHRRGGVCKHPTDVGLTLVAGRAYECWGHTPDVIGLEDVEVTR